MTSETQKAEARSSEPQGCDAAAPEARPAGSRGGPAAFERVLDICNEKGLHARASAKFAEVAGRFDADVRVTRDQMTVSAVSIMGLLMLAAAKGSEIHVASRGPDAEAALDALDALVADRFGEER